MRPPLLSRLLVPVLLVLLAALSRPAAAGTGTWVSGSAEGRPAAEVVTLVGEGGISANRVSVSCDRFGAVAISFARRPGMVAQVPMTVILWTEAGSIDITGTTNGYGVLMVSGAQASEAARLLAAARRPAHASLGDGGIFGPVSVAGSTAAIGRVLTRCGPQG